LALAGSAALRAGEGAPGVWRIGVGTSLEADAAKAGDAAAAEARKAYGAGEVKLVLVYAVRAQVTEEMIAAVAKHFPRNLIYGGEILAPLTPVTNLPNTRELESPAGIGVCAIGGDVSIAVAADSTATPVADTDAAAEGDDIVFAAYRASGRRLGAELLKALEACNRPGRLLLAFGDQFNGSNRHLVFGMQDILGEGLPMVGVSAGNQSAKDAMEIIAGEIKQAMNFAVLFCGDFKVGQSMQGGAHEPAVADRVLAAALEQGEGAESFFGFIFNCRRRRVRMMEEENIAAGLGLADELAVIQKRMAGVPFFGGYGPGEIGVRRPGTPAEGTGFSVSAALLFPLAK